MKYLIALLVMLLVLYYCGTLAGYCFALSEVIVAVGPQKCPGA